MHLSCHIVRETNDSDLNYPIQKELKEATTIEGQHGLWVSAQ